ncbi:trypco2 family protein [Kocuria sp. NPDC057446]|uniref:trypco2 family protein n=1 Tax=Kocuria sp. NPDC057446 TaxID=3346137 RepID=UPI0036B84DA7
MKADGLAGKVSLADAIEALRAELTKAMNSSPEEGVQFRVGPVELTVEAAVTTAGEGSAGIKWWLVEAGAKASRQTVSTQTLRLTLNPVQTVREDGMPKNVDLQISDTDHRPPVSNAQKFEEADREPA